MEDAVEPRAFANPLETELGDDCVAVAAKSDASALGVLYESYYPRVYRYAFHRVGNVPDAEDITALVFMKVLEALPSYQPRHGGFAPWLFRIARNSVVDHYRRQRQHSTLDELDHVARDGDPEVQVLGNERAEELHELVAHLSSDQRDVVLLRYTADLTFPQIAATMNKNEPAVRMLLHRGLRKLKAIMSNG